MGHVCVCYCQSYGQSGPINKHKKREIVQGEQHRYGMREHNKRLLGTHQPANGHDDGQPIDTTQDVCCIKLVKKAESKYPTFVNITRIRLFDHMGRYTDVHVAMSDDTSGRHPYKRPQVCLPVVNGRMDLGTDRRFINPISSAVVHAMQNNKHVVWIPIRIINPERNDEHSNAILIDLNNKTITLFEPHGSDPLHPGHGSWQYYYDAPCYYGQAKAKLEREFPSFTVRLPTDYQPAVFGQSRTMVKRLLTGYNDNGDKWCALWTTLFFKYTLTLSPLQFVTKINGMTNEALTTFVVNDLLSTF